MGLSQKRHNEFHHPMIEGKTIEADPYLVLPFKRSDLEALQKERKNRILYAVEEGWRYSRAEEKIHGITNHRGSDFKVPYGTPIYAPCDGFAMASYHTYRLREGRNHALRYHQGKVIWFGLGYFVQLYAGEQNRFLQFAHLSDIAPSIPFTTPLPEEKWKGDWTPRFHNIPTTEIPHHSAYVQVKRGDLLGKVGVSGLRSGNKPYNEYEERTTRPIIIDEQTAKAGSHDGVHLHLEEFLRRQVLEQPTQTLGEKTAWRDPYDLYLSFKNYPDPQHPNRKMGPEPLWVLGADGLPCYAEVN